MRYIIGIDEVGRGSLAGPVTVAAVAMPTVYKLRPINYKLRLRDSKKLSPSQRGAWFSYLKRNRKIIYAIAHVQPTVIDKINISNAANRAAGRALGKLMSKRLLRIKGGGLGMNIYLDGGLYIYPELKTTNYKLKTRTVIRGDEKIKAIALASIVAKVTRDLLMARKDHEFPVYGFLQHKGYGTKAHRESIAAHGLSPVHRRSFIGNLVIHKTNIEGKNERSYNK